MCSAVQGGFQVTKRICKHKLFQVQKLQKACITRKTDQSGFKRLLWNKNDEALFIEVHKKLGNKWALLSKKIKGK
jgi:hypothetical protein